MASRVVKRYGVEVLDRISVGTRGKAALERQAEVRRLSDSSAVIYLIHKNELLGPNSGRTATGPETLMSASSG